MLLAMIIGCSVLPFGSPAQLLGCNILFLRRTVPNLSDMIFVSIFLGVSKSAIGLSRFRSLFQSFFFGIGNMSLSFHCLGSEASFRILFNKNLNWFIASGPSLFNHSYVIP